MTKNEARTLISQSAVDAATKEQLLSLLQGDGELLPDAVRTIMDAIEATITQTQHALGRDEQEAKRAREDLHKDAEQTAAYDAYAADLKAVDDEATRRMDDAQQSYAATMDQLDTDVRLAHEKAHQDLDQEELSNVQDKLKPKSPPEA